MRQMQVPRAKKGETVSFDECAATSVKAPKAFEQCHTHYKHGDKVTYKGEIWEVIYDPNYIGLDGRHWVKIRLGDDVTHVPCGKLS